MHTSAAKNGGLVDMWLTLVHQIARETRRMEINRPTSRAPR